MEEVEDDLGAALTELMNRERFGAVTPTTRAARLRIEDFPLAGQAEALRVREIGGHRIHGRRSGPE
jgi:hypothetical protein